MRPSHKDFGWNLKRFSLLFAWTSPHMSNPLWVSMKKQILRSGFKNSLRFLGKILQTGWNVNHGTEHNNSIWDDLPKKRNFLKDEELQDKPSIKAVGTTLLEYANPIPKPINNCLPPAIIFTRNSQ